MHSIPDTPDTRCSNGHHLAGEPEPYDLASAISHWQREATYAVATDGLHSAAYVGVGEARTAAILAAVAWAEHWREPELWPQPTGRRARDPEAVGKAAVMARLAEQLRGQLAVRTQAAGPAAPDAQPSVR